MSGKKNPFNQHFPCTVLLGIPRIRVIDCFIIQKFSLLSIVIVSLGKYSLCVSIALDICIYCTPPIIIDVFIALH